MKMSSIAGKNYIILFVSKIKGKKMWFSW